LAAELPGYADADKEVEAGQSAVQLLFEVPSELPDSSNKRPPGASGDAHRDDDDDGDPDNQGVLNAEDADGFVEDEDEDEDEDGNVDVDVDVGVNAGMNVNVDVDVDVGVDVGVHLGGDVDLSVYMVPGSPQIEAALDAMATIHGVGVENGAADLAPVVANDAAVGGSVALIMLDAEDVSAELPHDFPSLAQEAAAGLSLLGNVAVPPAAATHAASVSVVEGDNGGNGDVGIDDVDNGNHNGGGDDDDDDDDDDDGGGGDDDRCHSGEEGCDADAAAAVNRCVAGPTTAVSSPLEDNETDEDGRKAGAISEAEDDGAGGDGALAGEGGDGLGVAEAEAEARNVAFMGTLLPVVGGQDAAHDIYYELVPRFRSCLVRVQYPALVTRIATKEAAVARQNVVIDRNGLLDAALVRIMKRRKTLGYQQLVAEVLAQVSRTFKPEARAVKDRLEHLIEREFIERSPQDTSVLFYSA
jgi:hypothetical protein